MTKAKTDSGRVRVSQNAPASKSASHRAWTEALSDPRFRDALEEGLADVEAGRTKPWSEIRKRIRSS